MIDDLEQEIMTKPEITNYHEWSSGTYEISRRWRKRLRKTIKCKKKSCVRKDKKKEE